VIVQAWIIEPNVVFVYGSIARMALWAGKEIAA
jgi:hypothetical protein